MKSLAEETTTVKQSSEVSIDGQGERLIVKSEFQRKKEERKVGKTLETKRSPNLETCM